MRPRFLLSVLVVATLGIAAPTVGALAVAAGADIEADAGAALDRAELGSAVDRLGATDPLALLPVTADLDAHVHVSPAPASQATTPASAPPADSSGFLPSHLADGPPEAAAGASLLALLLGALALGIDGLRALPQRLVRGTVRLVRIAAGGLLGLALFSRLQRTTLLDNPTRARVHEAIAQDPGLSLSDIGPRAGIAWGTSVHHLRRLEEHGLVVSSTTQGHRRYFLANTTTAAERSAVAVVMHPTARRIAHLVSQHPGIDQSGICHALGLNNPAASKHLGQFEQQGLVLSQRKGRSRHYQATGNLHAALRLVEPSAPQVWARPQASPLQVPAVAF